MATYVSASLDHAVVMKTVPTAEHLCRLWGLHNKHQIETLYFGKALVECKVLAPRMRVHCVVNELARKCYNIEIKGDCVLVDLTARKTTSVIRRKVPAVTVAPAPIAIPIKEDFDADGNRVPFLVPSSGGSSS